MNVIPTLEGGLAIEPESDLDWEVLEMITRDIRRPAHLAESLADLMADDGDWSEYVVPDLVEGFNNQTQLVAAAIRDARENDDPAVYITPGQAEKWYGALNQCRLALEARYRLSAEEDFESAPAEMRSAHFRDRFYLMLQSMLLEYVLEED